MSWIQNNLIITQGLPLAFLTCILYGLYVSNWKEHKTYKRPFYNTIRWLLQRLYHEIFTKTKVCLARNNQRVTRSSKTCGGYLLIINSYRFSSQMSNAKRSLFSLWLGLTRAPTKAIWSGPWVLLVGKASTPSPCAWGEYHLSKGHLEGFFSGKYQSSAMTGSTRTW